ncbi:recombinase family protein [Helcococcus kunzii]|uniref:recombinase family protein n=1 Tax=Helcococcus kunzii TaxID=40091 RepID=UPI001C97C8E3|nr:recombinase family protein [Helcococcus kunzii]QZO76345.1 recombinase family protein [Helcococcus kunzii]
MESNVFVIPAKKKKGNILNKEEKRKLRVAAYCRVSTDTDEQATSYDTQVNYYTSYIKNNPDWDFAGVYADDGISGTYTKKRDGFNSMIASCMKGEVDMIITNSISRFARNTVDCLNYIRKLKKKNIPVFFEKESINTMDSKGEVLLTIMASLAQQESQSLSQNVKLGFQFRFKQGKISVNHNRFLGYTKDENGNLVIEPTEAITIKRIFLEFLEGSSLRDIAKGLEKDNILTGAGRKKWIPSSVRRILTNEKYMGDALLQKTYTVDFLNKTRVKNDGIVPQYYVQDSHEAIIPKNIFMKVQEELSRRANINENCNKKRIYSSKYALSSLIKCGKCGEIYRRVVYTNRGVKVPVWRCLTRIEEGPHTCDAETLSEELIQEKVLEAINKIIDGKEKIKSIIKSNIEKALIKKSGDEIIKLDQKMLDIQKEVLQKANAKEDYTDLALRLEELREEKNEIMLKAAKRETLKERLKEMKEFLEEKEIRIERFDDVLVRKLTESIEINGDTVLVEFKSGIKIEVK